MCARNTVGRKTNITATHASSYGVTYEKPRVRERIAIQACICTFACTRSSACISKRSRQQRETKGTSVCEHACAPKGQSALLRFNSLSHCYCSEVNVRFLLKIKSRGARNPPDLSSSHINGKFSLEQ